MAWWFKIRQAFLGSVVALALLAGTALHGEAPRGAHPLKVRKGTLTVNGLSVVTGLEMRIANLNYLYVCLPGEGTVIIGERPFAGAQEQKNAFHGNALTVVAGSSRIQLTAANRLRGTRAAFVRFDHGLDTGMRRPAIAYGDAAIVPAVWPEQGIEARVSRRRVKGSAQRALRTAKLCRPSAHGGERCATVREVVFKP